MATTETREDVRRRYVERRALELFVNNVFGDDIEGGEPNLGAVAAEEALWPNLWDDDCEPPGQTNVEYQLAQAQSNALLVVLLTHVASHETRELCLLRAEWFAESSSTHAKIATRLVLGEEGPADDA